jgi:uncharacterized protein YjbI with pentapeptide repeats
MSYQDKAKSEKSSVKSTFGLTVILGLCVLTLAVGWLLFGPVSIVSKLIDIVSLLLAAGILMWWSKRQQQNQLTSRQTRQNYLAILQKTESLEERQLILDNMMALNLLKQSQMVGINLSDMNLAESNLSGADLSVSKQKGVDLREAKMKAANFHLSHLPYANLQKANLAQANFSGATLNSSDLSDSNLQGANLSAASLIDCDLRAADLRGANLRHANLHYADLSNAKLDKADLSFCILPDGSTWTSKSDIQSFINPENKTSLAAMLFARTHQMIKGDAGKGEYV